MQSTHSFPSRLVSLKHHLKKLLIPSLLVTWATLLTVYTIQIQHSSKPFLQSQNNLAQYNSSTIAKNPKNPQFLSQPQESTNPKQKIDQSMGKASLSAKPSIKTNINQEENKESSINQGIGSQDLVGIGVASMTVVGLAVIGTPAAVVAGAGFVVWLATRTLLGN